MILSDAAMEFVKSVGAAASERVDLLACDLAATASGQELIGVLEGISGQSFAASQTMAGNLEQVTAAGMVNAANKEKAQKEGGSKKRRGSVSSLLNMGGGKTAGSLQSPCKHPALTSPYYCWAHSPYPRYALTVPWPYPR